MHLRDLGLVRQIASWGVCLDPGLCGMARGEPCGYTWEKEVSLATSRVRDHHALLGKGSLRSRGNFLQNKLILVAADAELDQCIPLILRQKIFVHPIDYLVYCALGGDFISLRLSTKSDVDPPRRRQLVAEQYGGTKRGYNVA
jgi:hypothetical protein